MQHSWTQMYLHILFNEVKSLLQITENGTFVCDSVKCSLSYLLLFLPFIFNYLHNRVTERWSYLLFISSSLYCSHIVLPDRVEVNIFWLLSHIILLIMIQPWLCSLPYSLFKISFFLSSTLLMNVFCCCLLSIIRYLSYMLIFFSHH